MRSHILREISKNELNPKKAYVVNRGKLTEKKKFSVATAESKNDDPVVEVVMPEAVSTSKLDLIVVDAVTAVIPEDTSAIMSEVMTSSTEQPVDEVKFSIDATVEDKKKKGSFFKKKQSLAQ